MWSLLDAAGRYFVQGHVHVAVAVNWSTLTSRLHVDVDVGCGGLAAAGLSITVAADGRGPAERVVDGGIEVCFPPQGFAPRRMLAEVGPLLGAGAQVRAAARAAGSRGFAADLLRLRRFSWLAR